MGFQTYSKEVSSPHSLVLPEGGQTGSITLSASASASVAIRGKANAVLLTVHGILSVGTVPNVWVATGPTGVVATRIFRITDGDWVVIGATLTSFSIANPFANYVFVAGDQILIESGTDTITGVVPILAKNSDNQLQLGVNLDGTDSASGDIVGQVLPRDSFPISAIRPQIVKLKKGDTFVAAFMESAVAGAVLLVTPLLLNDA